MMVGLFARGPIVLCVYLYLTRTLLCRLLIPFIQITSHGVEYEMVALEKEPDWIFVRRTCDGVII